MTIVFIFRINQERLEFRVAFSQNRFYSMAKVNNIREDKGIVTDPDIKGVSSRGVPLAV